MTEKNYNPQQKEKKAMKKQKAIKSSPNAVASLKEKKAMKKQKAVEKVKKPEQPIEAPKKVEEKQKVESSPNTVALHKNEIAEANTNPHSDLHEEKQKVETIETPKVEEKKIETPKVEEQKTTEKKEVKKEVPKIKRTEVSAKGINLPISTKDAKFVCKFIVKKRIGDAIRDLEKVEVKRKAVPMKGEIPHRKGKGISSGRFPKKAAKNFIVLLKSLAANANESNLDEPIIVEAMANMAARPYGRFGRTQKKRTHVKVIAKDKTKLKKKVKK